MNERALAQACSRFSLAPPRRRARGQVGSHSGIGLGSSVEFFDFRKYVPGDDLRHIDWAVLGRTGELTVRRFREEVQPRCDVLLDTSRSMGLDDGRKAALALELCAFFLRAAQSNGRVARLHLLGADLGRTCEPREVRFEADGSTLFGKRAARIELPECGMRVVISDFLSPHSPLPTLRQLDCGAASLILVRLLGPWEQNPDEEALWNLRDAETGAELAVNVTERTRAYYMEKLNAIDQSIASLSAACGACFVRVTADCSLPEVLERDFVPLQVVLPR